MLGPKARLDQLQQQRSNGEGSDTKDPSGQGSPQGHQARKPRPKSSGVVEGSSAARCHPEGWGAGPAKRRGHPNREFGP